LPDEPLRTFQKVLREASFDYSANSALPLRMLSFKSFLNARDARMN
jgi:hypothetical protein